MRRRWRRWSTAPTRVTGRDRSGRVRPPRRRADVRPPASASAGRGRSIRGSPEPEWDRADRSGAREVGRAICRTPVLSCPHGPSHAGRRFGRPPDRRGSHLGCRRRDGSRPQAARCRSRARRSRHRSASLLIDAAAMRIGAGADPKSVLLLTGSGRLGARTRGALTATLLSARTEAPCRAAVREPLVRSVHAYAFAVLRLAAQPSGRSAATPDHRGRAGRRHPGTAAQVTWRTVRRRGRTRYARP